MINTHNDIHGYLPVNDAIMRLGFYLTGAGRELIGPRQVYPQPSHPDLYTFGWDRGRILPEYQLLYIHSGEGEFESKATGRCKILPGTLLWLIPDVWHRYRPDNRTGWEQLWISFNGQLTHLWQRSGIIHPESSVQTLANPGSLRDRYLKIIDLVIRHPKHSARSVSFEALQMLAWLFATSPPAPGVSPGDSVATTRVKTDDELVQTALEIIWTYSHRNLSVDSIAAQLNVTRRLLDRRFAQEHGRSVLEEVTACRLNRAQRMLCETHLPIKQIAYSTGFSSSTHMAVVFRRELNTTPEEYRHASWRNFRL